MNIRTSLAVITLGLASTMAFASTPEPAKAAAAETIKPVTVKHHHALKRKAGESEV